MMLFMERWGSGHVCGKPGMSVYMIQMMILFKVGVVSVHLVETTSFGLGF